MSTPQLAKAKAKAGGVAGQASVGAAPRRSSALRIAYGARQVSLEAARPFAGALALRTLASHVELRRLMAAHLGDGDAVQGGVQPELAHDLTGGGLEGDGGVAVLVRGDAEDAYAIVHMTSRRLRRARRSP